MLVVYKRLSPREKPKRFGRCVHSSTSYFNFKHRFYVRFLHQYYIFCKCTYFTTTYIKNVKNVVYLCRWHIGYKYLCNVRLPAMWVNMKIAIALLKGIVTFCNYFLCICTSQIRIKSSTQTCDITNGDFIPLSCNYLQKSCTNTTFIQCGSQKWHPNSIRRSNRILNLILVHPYFLRRSVEQRQLQNSVTSVYMYSENRWHFYFKQNPLYIITFSVPH